MQIMRPALTIVLAVLCGLAASSALSADEFGIFEKIHESSVSFEETTAAVESALHTSGLLLHGSHIVRVPEDKARAKVYVLTSSSFSDAASAESPFPTRLKQPVGKRSQMFSFGTMLFTLASPILLLKTKWCASIRDSGVMAKATPLHFLALITWPRCPPKS